MKFEISTFLFASLPFFTLAGTSPLGNSGTALEPRRAGNYTAIPNGQAYYDTAGDAIQSFGGGFLEVDGIYYWVGQDFTPSIDSDSISKVNMYKSTDLLNWDKVGSILTANTPDVNGNQLLSSCKIERPKLLYNASTKKYVLWAHWEVNANYGASEIITATANNVEGPYIVTKTGHRRPGHGNNSPDAMGDRLGHPILDLRTAAKDTSDTTSHPYIPVTADYPPQPSQYLAPGTANPTALEYVTSSTYGAIALGTINLNFTLKAIVANMTAFDRSAYDKYSANYSVSAANYIVRWPTNARSAVTTAKFTIGSYSTERADLVAPVIHPGLDESTSNTVVLVNSGDAAFITVTTDNATIYYTTDGSDPSANSTIYTAGTRIPVSGNAGTSLTVKSIAISTGNISPISTQIYEVAVDSSIVPIFKPVINFASGTYTKSSVAFATNGMRIYAPSYGAVAYYTTDGLDPNPPVKGDNIGFRSRDFTVWQDPKDDLVYLVGASDDLYFRIWQLTDDYTDVVADKEYDVFVHIPREAPALVRNHGKRGKYVYMITSSQSGYYPNQSQYKRTTDLTIGFSSPRDPITGYRDGQSSWNGLEPVGDPSTYYSQPTWIMDIGTSTHPAYIYVGDRNNVNQLYSSTYVFLQLTIDDDAPSQAGNTTTGLMALTYVPNLQVDTKRNRITPSPYKLLSLNKPVNASAATQMTAEQIAAGTFNYTAEAANDGINYDVDAYDSIQEYYQPLNNPFFWSVDLGKSYDLAWIGISARSVGGSDSVYRYDIDASNDGLNWTQLIDNSANALPGFTSHILSGRYRYVRYNNHYIVDVVHQQEADWEKGIYEISVYGSG